MINLGVAYQAAGKLVQAVELLEEALEATIAVRGADHHDSLGCMNNLAMAYQAAKRPEDALLLIEKVARLTKGRFGADHPHTLLAINNLAAFHNNEGRREQALPLFQEAAAGLEKRQFRHENASNIINNLIACHERLKQFEQAESWRRKWLAVVKEREGADSLAYASELAGLGLFLLKQKKPADAEPMLRECLTIRQKKQPNDWRTFNAQALLGAALLRQQKYVDAEPLLVQGYQGMKKNEAQLPPAGKARLIEALERLVEFYEATGGTEEVAKWKSELEAWRAADASR